MSKLLPDGFEIPEGTAYTIALNTRDKAIVERDTALNRVASLESIVSQKERQNEKLQHDNDGVWPSLQP